MMAQTRATQRDADTPTERPALEINGVASGRTMSLQSGRGYEAMPQAFARLTGSHLAKPDALPPISRTLVTE